MAVAVAAVARARAGAVASNPPLISLRGVTKTYGQGATMFQALKGVDLDIAAGDFVAVMGPSGSGKSTTMNILGCLDVPTSGTYRFLGTEVQSMTRDQRSLLRRKYLGFVFQGFNLLARTTAAENADLREARKRIRLLEQENEVLRRAAAYLSQANLPGK